MYPRLFEEPPSDVARVDANGPDISVSGLAAGPTSCRVLALDAYGRRIGRTLYPASNELRVVVPA